jgi:hypothetical protein
MAVNSTPAIQRFATFRIDEGTFPRTPQRVGSRRLAAIETLRKIAAGLRKRGYSVSDAKPAKGIDAGIRWEPRRGLTITLLIGLVTHEKGYIRFVLISDMFLGLFSRVARKRTVDRETLAQWKLFLSSVDEEIRTALNAETISWMTQEEAELTSYFGGSELE